jgi:hypothetical protein
VRIKRNCQWWWDDTLATIGLVFMAAFVAGTSLLADGSMGSVFDGIWAAFKLNVLCSYTSRGSPSLWILSCGVGLLRHHLVSALQIRYDSTVLTND